MCVVAIAWQAHPKYQLVLAGNRDELHARPAAPVARWEDAPLVIGGRDLQSGGTWLGVSEAGRLAVVTNLRDFGDPNPARMSRGALLTDYLSNDGQYSQLPTGRMDDFNPFSLIVADANGPRLLANRPNLVDQCLNPGVHGLSNTPANIAWPRRDYLAEMLARWVLDGSAPAEHLFDVLARRYLPAKFQGDDGDSAPIFLADEIYGTRCSTIIAIDYDGQGLALERSFGPAGSPRGEVQISFQWPTKGHG